MDENEISLADLAPERLTFFDNAFGGDGARHEWRGYADLGLADLASLRRIQEELTRAAAIVGKADATGDELEAAAHRLAAGLDATLRLLLPTLPAERITAIPLRGKERLLTWWRSKQPEEATTGGALPLAPASAPSKPSPASSPATA